MKLTDDFDDDNKSGLPVIYTTIGVFACISIIILIVILSNQDSNYPKTSKTEKLTVSTDTINEDKILQDLDIGKSTLTSDQLDFWNMYKEDTEISDNAINESYEQNAQKLIDEEKQKEEEEDLSEGGTKTKVIRPDGTEQWIMINAYITKNNYDFNGLVYEEPVMKYYANGTKASYMGVDIDADNGSVDFGALKNAGVDFVMIRLGYRGYQSGTLSIDPYFYDYLNAADQAGLKIGVYFESQAVTVQEAQEEAQLVIDNLTGVHITYPVVFKSGLIPNDKSRVEDLTKSQLSEISNAFCEKIKTVGFYPMVYGNKYWLLRKLDISLLGDYDIWLSQDEDQPDYPYEFAMWQYSNKGKINGISNDVGLDISFIDYSQK